MTNRLEPTYLPALKGRIGKWAFYTTLMTFSEIADRIRLSDEVYQNKNLSDMVQRSVNSDRAEKIAEYLLREEERFFPAMVVAVFEGEPNWLEFAITKQSQNIDFDINQLSRAKLDSFGFLSLTGDEQLFPLDGQHRLAGIRKALEDPEGQSSYLPDDEVTVMLVAHEPSTEGRTRSRRLFTVLNKRAVSVKKHETIALDEDDVMAIATRHLVEKFAPLSREGVVSFRTNANIKANEHRIFTAIVTLYDILNDLFKVISKRKPLELKFNRPNDDWIEVYLSCAECFFDQMIEKFPEIGLCLNGSDPSEVIAENRHENGGHILFRPVGQRLLAQLVAEAARGALDEAFEERDSEVEKVKKKAVDAIKSGFERFANLPTDLTQKPYAELIWEPDTQKMQVGRATLVRDIVLKRYGLIKPSVDSKLQNRLKSSLGEARELDEFLW
ncbi:DNA sulfur modification protein DndB [uncultured Litoreibacter sp.]|uniref:DGQHR domain-containing protein n=1 Tax=uncultured Litoreibacter sp. TaxID=1392394 RepID=UPI00263200DA|nr:DNA sulfur modification protein DndB [uncultured Litoreibacter sp.]